MNVLIQHNLLVPIGLFLISIIGLITALIGDGWWNVWAWLLLSVPLLICVPVLKKGFKNDE